ncbi:MAG TPA: hypothetical protein VK564_11035 [Thermodesulfobacteriota bacterium]|nr:hypothetical protein [Thermodesulfobacteriota bacterium]
MKRAALFLLLVFLLSVGFMSQAQGGVLDLFSGLTGRTSNDAQISSDDYSPDVAKTLGPLKGKLLRLNNFVNRAENTKQFSYPSAEGKFFYVVGHGSVESYFWYCFQKALSSAGLIVLEETSTAKAPSLSLTLFYLTDKQLKGEVTAANGNNPLKKIIEVSFEPPQTDKREESALSAYAFMDKIILAVFADPEIIKALDF